MDTLIRCRAVYKRKITIALKSLEACHADQKSPLVDSLKLSLKEVKGLNKQIEDLLLSDEDNFDSSGELAPSFSEELSKALNYTVELEAKIKSFAVSSGTADNLKSVSCDLKLPHLKCDTFSGEQRDGLKYYAFITQFKNIIGNRTNLSCAVKFTYLKSFLTGYAAKVVYHLHINDDNYTEALEILDREFLNRSEVVHNIFDKLLHGKVKSDKTFLETKIYINEVKSFLFDLKQYGTDLLANNSDKGFISHIVFSKLPEQFRIELVRKLNDNYPSISQIFDNYVEIINTLNLRLDSRVKFETVQNFADTFKPIKPKTKTFHDSQAYNNNNNNKTLVYKSGKKSWNNQNKFLPMSCKFCGQNNHRMVNCFKYPSHESRVERCSVLKLCSLCTSTKHGFRDCPSKLDFDCLICHTRKHVSALCPKFNLNKIEPRVGTNLCLNSASNGCASSSLLPTTVIAISNGKTQTKVRMLIDTGSQRSYLTRAVLDRTGYRHSNDKLVYTVHSFLDTGVKSLSEHCVCLNLTANCKVKVPVLIDDDFNLSFEVESLSDATANIKKCFNMSDPNLGLNSNTVEVEGIMGADLIQHLPSFDKVKCINGYAFSLANGIVPFGSIDNFLTKAQLISKYAQTSTDNLNVIVNFVMDPCQANPDPIGDVLVDSQVEAKLDNLFNIESLGIGEEEIAKSDSELIAEFKHSIEFKDSKYHVELPWKSDLIDSVASNFSVAKAVLSRVVSKLKTDDLYKQYDAVFQQQLADGVLEKIPLSNADHRVWIPHRPVVKTSDQTTTKIRPVLNCSLKIGNAPSLNESAYPGINLLTDFFKVLLRIRINKFIITSDIKHAFLQIKLKLESDRNKFSILWFNERGELQAYRYTSIVFGYASSPFVLNFVVQHHVSGLPKDSTTLALQNNFYVDNLFFTANNPDSLVQFYKEASERMLQGGFLLRSWQSSCPEVRKVLSKGGLAVEHNEDYEKLLGYQYFPKTDQLAIAPITSFIKNVTKRSVLSFNAKNFDPLGLCSPVTNTGKVFMRDLWQNKVEWDEVLSEQQSKKFPNYANDCELLSEIKFDRSTAVDNKEADLLIFTDASKLIYGFCAYTRQNVDNHIKTNLVFAKSKIAPMKTKSLPTLELLAVYLALLCLDPILAALLSITIKNVTIAVDSQVVLTWILDAKIKIKNQFASNRIKDIINFISNLKSKFNISINLKYISTSNNPADLLTRGYSTLKFKDSFNFWIHGPNFLKDAELVWPHSNLLCISSENRTMLCNTATTIFTVKNTVDILDIKKYSSLHTLLRITAFVLKFIDLKIKKCVKTFHEHYSNSLTYWIRRSQISCYSEEIIFCENPKLNVPIRVKNLNLFIDSNNLLRSKGRLGKCTDLTLDAVNPIVLPTKSSLTTLLIRDAHTRCKHLGVGSTLNYLRNQGYWIVRGRHSVNSVLKDCVTCKKINVRAFKYPKPSDLTGDRVNFQSPFDITGIDFTGHVNVKFDDTVTKMYLLVFTCMQIRAIHIELVPNMSSLSVLLAFIIFCNFYRLPSTVYSDNANSFFNSLKMLNKSNLDDEWVNFLLKNKIKHKTIPLYSAWVGSTWERQMRTIKSCLYKTIGKKHLEFYQLKSLLSDICNTINSRPLTYRDDDVSFHALTPNNFLKPYVTKTILFGSIEGSDIVVPNRKDLVASLEKREVLLEKFKERYFEEYLLSLRETGRDLYDDRWEEKVKVGDIVLIRSPSLSRPYWSMGRIQELLTGSDSKTRSVKVFRPNGDPGIFSINQLYPLELSLQEVEPVHEPPVPAAVVNAPARTQRRAAQQCKRRLASLYQYEA